MADWIFAKRDGGQDQGPHDAGVEAFMGDLEWYIAREAIQNSLDARLDKKKPVNVEFQLYDCERSKIPGIETLASTFTQCSEYWKHDKDATVLFKDASEFARKSAITVLRISDSNTTGVKEQTRISLADGTISRDASEHPLRQQELAVPTA